MGRPTNEQGISDVLKMDMKAHRQYFARITGMIDRLRTETTDAEFRMWVAYKDMSCMYGTIKALLIDIDDVLNQWFDRVILPEFKQAAEDIGIDKETLIISGYQKGVNLKCVRKNLT